MTENSEAVDEYPTISEAASKVNVFSFNQQSYVPLQDFQRILVIGQGLEGRLVELIEHLGSEQEEDDFRMKSLAMQVAVELLKASPNNVLDDGDTLERLYRRAFGILEDDSSYIVEEMPEKPTESEESDPLAALVETKGDS